MAHQMRKDSKAVGNSRETKTCVNNLPSGHMRVVQRRNRRSHIHSHRSCKRSPFCSKSTLEELSAADPENGRRTKLEPETPGLFPVPPWTLDSDLEPEVLLLTCRPQANPDLDLPHVSCMSMTSPHSSLNETQPSMLSHGPPSIALTNGQALPDAPTTTVTKAKQRPSQRQRFKFSIKGVSYFSRKSKRCLYYNFQFWLWRKWGKVRFLPRISKAKRQTKVRSNHLLSLSCCPKPKRQAKIQNSLPSPGPKTGCSHKKGERVKNHLSSPSPGPNPNSKAQSQRHAQEFQRCHLQKLEQLQERKSGGSEASSIQGHSEDWLDSESSSQKPCEAAGPTELCTTSNSLQSHTTHRTIVMGINKNIPEKTVPSSRHGQGSSSQKQREFTGPTEICNITILQQSQATDRNVGMGINDKKMPEKTLLSSRHGKESSGQKMGEPSGPVGSGATINPRQDQDANRGVGEGISSQKRHKKTVPYQSQHQTSVSHKVLIKHIHEFLDGLYRMYGSFIPLEKKDALRHLKKILNIDFNQSRKDLVFSEVRKYQAALAQRPVPSFRVVYKKHLLTLDDLSTLEDQNWLNDQIINMYGELIMDSAHNKVHFFNSFFHRQLVTKGYEGVKRWTKQVDLFSNTLLLVPIHLEVHWCLVVADTVKRRIQLYDSQGNTFKKVLKNILKYLMTEAKHRQRTAFQNGWMVSDNERIPQQTNENDCGVFILEYCRCLALGKHLNFSQVDIPRIRKRIYKELCDCKLQV